MKQAAPVYGHGLPLASDNRNQDVLCPHGVGSALITLLVKDDVLAVSDEAVGSFSFVSSWLLKIVTWFFGLWLDNCDPKARPASEANTRFYDVLEMNVPCDQLRLTLCNPVDCSLPGFSAHGIFQNIGVLEGVAIFSSRGSSQPRDRTCVSSVSCTAGRFSTHGATTSIV